MSDLTSDQREWINGLRCLADYAETHPDAAQTYSTFRINVFTDTVEEMAEKAKRLGGPFEKVSEYGYYNLRKHFGPHTVDLCAKHDAVCEQVQVGTETKEVPDPELLAAVPKVTVEEPVYEWRCPDSILAAAAAT